MTILQAIINAGVAYEEDRRAAIEECQRASAAAREAYHQAIAAAQAKLHAAMRNAYEGPPSEFVENTPLRDPAAILQRETRHLGPLQWPASGKSALSRED